jgi:class 3 adenylate cyclase
VDDEVASLPDDVPLLTPAVTRQAPDAERRQLTVLFCDLVGSTQLSGQLDPEDLRAVVRAYQEAAAAVIQRYEGHIAQYLGDGLLVYFGYPVAHEDDARRAVHTGLGIVEAVATLNTRLVAQYGIQLAVRLGIHTGPVVVGVMGGGERHEHLALGETPNIAGRLQVLAPANTVVMSAVTARLVQGTFALEALGTHTLYGVAEPMMVSRVRGLLVIPSSDEEFVAATGPGLVGREEERVLSQSSIFGQNLKIGCQEFNDLQTPKLSKKQLCDRTPQRPHRDPGRNVYRRPLPHHDGPGEQLYYCGTAGSGP